MRSYTSWLLLTAAVRCSATFLYVASYSGIITTLSLEQNDCGDYTLTPVANASGCGTSPSWLTLDEKTGILYCADEGLETPDAVVATFQTTANGSLVLLDQVTTLPGGVSSVVINDGKALAVAQYSSSALSTFNITSPSRLNGLETFNYTMPAPGPNASRQDAPHPHEAFIDPTGAYVFVPDLGADQVRVFSFDPATSLLTANPSLNMTPGSGPRHGTFYKNPATNTTYLYILTELVNTLLGYEVTYNANKTLTFSQILATQPYGNLTLPSSAGSAELLISPDNNYLIASVRNTSSFSIPNFDPANSTEIVSDTLSTFKIDHATGLLEFLEIAPAGGAFPRQLSVNREGDLLAVGLQNDARVVLKKRDVETGKLGDFVAEIDIEGQVVCVIWDERL